MYLTEHFDIFLYIYLVVSNYLEFILYVSFYILSIFTLYLCNLSVTYVYNIVGFNQNKLIIILYYIIFKILNLLSCPEITHIYIY